MRADILNNLQIKNDPSIIGNRIKSVRMLAGYNRKAFSEKTGISAVTLRVWEEPPSDRHGVTENGIFRLIKALEICGINCTPEWIIEGTGLGPSLIGINTKEILDSSQSEITWDEEESIFKDIESFKSNNPNSIVTMIIDGSMLPFYSYGDYVGGSKKFGSDIITLVGLNCIIELKDSIIIRKVSALSDNNKYTLTAVNIDQSVKIPIINEAEIISAAKIVWHRCKEKTTNIII